MLCQYSFENYKSFKDEVILDFYADNIEEHNETLIVDKYSNEKFLPVNVLYGPNGGGKTTVLESLWYLTETITQNLFISNSFRNLSQNPIKRIPISSKYHKFDDKCKDLPIKFDILFKVKKKTFNYSISFKDNNIFAENLYYMEYNEENANIVFERTTDSIKLGDKFNDIIVKNINNKISLLSYIAISYDIPIINDVINWFLSICFLNYDNPENDTKSYYPKTKKQKETLFKIIFSMGINIKDSRAVKDNNGRIKEVFLKHYLNDGRIIEIPFYEESAGTRKVFNLLYRIIYALEEGALTVIDELDAKLHPKLLQYIIEMYMKPEINKKGAQLLFTSHDISTMNADVFRRDEIWFCALNAKDASKLYSLSSFKKENGKRPRKDESYGKQYLEGRYGADPYLKKLLTWN